MSLKSQNLVNIFREALYRRALFIVGCCSLVIVFLVWVLGRTADVMQNADTLVNIGAALAGFLFTGQSILLALSPENHFISKAKKEGYLTYVHKFCIAAELSFLSSIFLGIDILPWEFIDHLFLVLFIYGLLLSIWSLKIYGDVIQFYVKSEHRQKHQ